MAERGRHPPHGRIEHKGVQVEGARYRGSVFVHLYDAWRVRILLFLASAYDGKDRGRGGDRQRGRAMMLARWRPDRGPKPGNGTVPNRTPGDDPERARRFRDAAMPHFDDVYTLARYLLRNATDAEDAVQECFL